MDVIETERLQLVQFSMKDTGFVFELLNEPAFLQYIGDKQVRSEDDACEYLANGPISSYRRHGFGLYKTVLKEGAIPIGMCGLLQRDGLPDPDLGFAYLGRHGSRGYAVEAAKAVLSYAATDLQLGRVVAIAKPDNHRSTRLLRKIGMRFERMVSLGEFEPELACYATPPGYAASGGRIGVTCV